MYNLYGKTKAKKLRTLVVILTLILEERNSGFLLPPINMGSEDLTQRKIKMYRWPRIIRCMLIWKWKMVSAVLKKDMAQDRRTSISSHLNSFPPGFSGPRDLLMP